MAKKNSFFGILKRIFIFQDILSWGRTMVPAVLEHNLGKYEALKKAFYLTALENLSGDYCEFGVFTGSSFVCAMRAHRKFHSLGSRNTRFFGFDSFTGFGDVAEEDNHWFYLNDTFAINKRKVIKYIKKKSKKLTVKIVEGYFEKTLEKRKCSSIGIRDLRIVFIDCDLKRPATLSLDFVKDGLQQGTIIIMDDFFSFRGDPTKGVAGAFYDFQKKNPGFEFRRLYDYGYGGVAYITSKVPKHGKAKS